MTKIKLAVIDDHELSLRAIIKLIKTERDLEVIFEAENGAHQLEQLKTKKLWCAYPP